MAKVYIFLADGFEEIEGLTVVDLLRRAKIDITMVSITGNIMVTGSHQIKTEADVLFEKAGFKDADMLVLPGGMPGTNHLMNHEGLDKLLKEFHSMGKSLAAICAAPSILGTKGLLDGKNAICYPGFEEKLYGATISNTAVVTDGNITTSKGMGTAIDFALSLIKNLKGADEAKRIADSIQYQHYSL
jgi:4-methyl-5(b-hydroxyethyl)-thiazole monophosphate biosynthesis